MVTTSSAKVRPPRHATAGLQACIIILLDNTKIWSQKKFSYKMSYRVNLYQGVSLNKAAAVRLLNTITKREPLFTIEDADVELTDFFNEELSTYLTLVYDASDNFILGYYVDGYIPPVRGYSSKQVDKNSVIRSMDDFVADCENLGLNIQNVIRVPQSLSLFLYYGEWSVAI